MSNPPMDSEVQEGKIWAIVGYIIWIVALIVLIQKKNAFALYHAKQALILTIAAIALYVVGFVIMMISTKLFFVMYIIYLAFLALMILGIINAVNGRMQPLPIIGQFAEKLFGGIQKA